MPEMIMLVGLPGTGKSTFTKNYESNSNYIILSTDAYIESLANEQGKNYNDLWKDNIKDAEKYMYENLKYAIINKLNIIWDQTNLSKSIRAKKLNKIPKSYNKKFLDFGNPDIRILHERMKRYRPEKIISMNVLHILSQTYEKPEFDEGFDSGICHEFT